MRRVGSPGHVTACCYAARGGGCFTPTGDHGGGGEARLIIRVAQVHCSRTETHFILNSYREKQRQYGSVFVTAHTLTPPSPH